MLLETQILKTLDRWELMAKSILEESRIIRNSIENPKKYKRDTEYEKAMNSFTMRLHKPKKTA